MPPRRPKTDCTKNGAFDEAAVGEVRQVVEVGDVVALELEARAVVVAGGEDVLDVLEGVAEDEVAGRLEMRLLPVEAEVSYLSARWKRPKLIEPMLSEATSGLNCAAGRTRSSTFM